GATARSMTSSTTSAPMNGTGEYAPMPPVFGPSSRSNARLWSCAAPMNDARVPSHNANTDSSGPTNPSSITHVRPASPNASPDRYARTPARASANDSVTITPLPAASPSVFTTYKPGSDSKKANARSSSPTENTAWRAVGTRAASNTSFIHAFEP